MAEDEIDEGSKLPPDARLESLDERLDRLQQAEAKRTAKSLPDASYQAGQLVLSQLIGCPLGGGIVGLADRYPRRLVDAACARAIAEGVHSYRHVKALTEQLVAQALATLDAEPARAAERAGSADQDLTQAHPLIRPADEYGELFARCALQQSTPTASTTQESSPT